MIGNYQREHYPLSNRILAVLVHQLSEVQPLSTKSSLTQLHQPRRFTVLILPLDLLVKTLQSVFDIISNLSLLPGELHGMKYAKVLQTGPSNKVCQELRDT